MSRKPRRYCGRCGARFVPSEEDGNRCDICWSAQVQPLWDSDDEAPAKARRQRDV